MKLQKTKITNLKSGDRFFKNENDKSVCILFFVDKKMIAYRHQIFGNKIGKLCDFRDVFVY